MERIQTANEELANSITHGLGILFSVIATSLLIEISIQQGSTLQLISSSIFGVTILLLYTFSTLYHTTREKRHKLLFRTFDHISIYLLIAGTYTPFLLIGISGTTGWVFFCIIWVVAAIGTVFKIFFTQRFKRASLIIYLVMGWMAIFLIHPLLESLSVHTISFVAVGGISYTLGTIFYTRRSITYSHAIWHIFVLTGTILHFIAVRYMFLEI